MERKEKNNWHGIAGIFLFMFGVTLIIRGIIFTIQIGFTGSASNLFTGEEDYSDFQIVFWGTIVSAIIYFITKNKN